MDSSILSIIFFLIITIIYFSFSSIGKIPLSISNLTNFSDYQNQNMYRLGLYFLIILVVEFFVSVFTLMNRCSSSIGSNIGYAFFYTFIPWFFIFGVMLAILVIFPSLKNTFSDVIGYFIVASRANNILSDILIDTNITKSLNEITDTSKKNSLFQSADAIVKLMGNKSVLINEIRPDNFIHMWNNILTPLMKQGISNLQEKQAELLNVVFLRDNIGEAMWYIYTGILVTSIVSYYLMSHVCQKSVSELQSSQQQYQQQQQQQPINDTFGTSS